MPSNAQPAAGTETLFRPITIGSMTLKNRIVMAPMTRNKAQDGIPADTNAEYYRKRAVGGVGLILTEGTVVDRPTSRNLPHVPFFHGDTALTGWQQVAEAVHGAGGKIGPQIWHTGSTRGSAGWEPDSPVESPSGIVKPGEPRGNVMSDADIADLIAAFARAAADSEARGFDMTEVHGAHGYLLDQFMWDGTNLRDDSWGGPTLPERTRVLVEIIKAIRAAVSPDYPVFLRLSQWKQQDYDARLAPTPAEMEAWLTPLADAGVDVFHCSQRRFWVPEFPELDGEDGLNFAGWAKKLTGKLTCSVGSVGLDGEYFGAFRGRSAGPSGVDKLIERMERDEFDLIAVGRILISDPDWVQKVRTGAETSGFDAEALKTLV
ncbi:NADH:flavin oxidoreductase [Pseudooceanicola sp.]|uniref:NADH:flavin oxidoreductase n=1 Tax=Pseudooceanicola sp. TaxID=1914328 RepID=UPI002612F4E0|nr:NADH:flavin oxidoreductase [Pseudooceanicola sp.]MDF1853982.1 NADH:flavin oxidoreductase [Pseudooceanicola sp.]